MFIEKPVYRGIVHSNQSSTVWQVEICLQEAGCGIWLAWQGLGWGIVLRRARRLQAIRAILTGLTLYASVIGLPRAVLKQ